jgi:hypothetical protein
MEQATPWDARIDAPQEAWGIIRDMPAVPRRSWNFERTAESSKNHAKFTYADHHTPGRLQNNNIAILI